MWRYSSAALLFAGAMFAVSTHQTISAQDAAAPTYYRDVLPILQKNCQSCHRPGQIGPFSMMTFETTRPWVRAIKTRVVNRQMPPWFADPHAGQFANDTSLRQADIDTIVEVGGRAARRRATDARAEGDRVADGRLADQAGPDRPRPRVPRAGAGRRRTSSSGRHHRAERVHRGHLDHVARDQAERPDGHASHLHLVRPASRDVKYYEWSWQESPRDEEGVATDRGATRRRGRVRPARARVRESRSGGAQRRDRRVLLLRPGRAGRRLPPASTRRS